MGAGRFSVDTVFNAKDGMSGTISKMESRAKRFEHSLAGANKAADMGAGAVTKVVATTAVAGAAAGAVLADVISTGAEFEQTLIGAAAKFSPAIRQGTKEFDQLRMTAEQVGASTEFNAQQAAAGLKDLASAGFNSTQAIAALPGVVDLATASEVDLAAASNMATKSLGAFNLKTDDAVQLGKNLSRINDVMSRTADATSASMEGLFQTILEGGPVATTTGASVETFMALAGQLAQSGIEASVAGTTLKNVFLTLAAPTKEASGALTALGISTKDSKGNMRDVLAILGDLEKKTAKMGTAKKAGVIEQIFGKIPIAGVSALLGGGIAQVEDLRTKLEAAGGSTARMAGIMRDSTKNDIDGFTSAVDGVKIAIFGVIKAPFRSLVQGLTDWTTANQKVIASGIEDFLKRATPLVENFGDGMRDAFKQAKPTIDSVGTALQTVFGDDSGAGPVFRAHDLGYKVTDLGITFLKFWLVTKAVTAATALWGFVVGTVRTGMLAYETAVTAVKWAVVQYQIWSKAGTLSTLAMSASSVIATGSLIAQRVGAFGAAVGMRALAIASWAASAPVLAVAAAIAAVLAAAYQLYAFMNENGGFEGLKGAFGVGTRDWGFKGVDEVMNRQAKKRRAEEDAKGGAAAPSANSAPGQPTNGTFNVSQIGGLESINALKDQLASLEKQGGQLPPGFGAPPDGSMPGGMSMPGLPPELMPQGSKDPPVVALKEESTAKLSQDIGRSIRDAIKGTIRIEIKDKGGNAEVTSSGSDVMSIEPSGSF